MALGREARSQLSCDLGNVGRSSQQEANRRVRPVPSVRGTQSRDSCFTRLQLGRVGKPRQAADTWDRLSQAPTLKLKPRSARRC